MPTQRPNLPEPMPPRVQLAIGRIFRLASRPEEPGDAASYEECRAIILDAWESRGAARGARTHDGKD